MEFGLKIQNNKAFLLTSAMLLELTYIINHAWNVLMENKKSIILNG